MLGIQVLCHVTFRRHFIRLLNTEDEDTGKLQTRYLTRLVLRHSTKVTSIITVKRKAD